MCYGKANLAAFTGYHAEPLRFLERIQGDICGLIQPLCGPFGILHGFD
jgi:hypothetical protein